jgi:hypothetical protein
MPHSRTHLTPTPLPRRASDLSKEAGRNTISATDVLTALRDLEFDDFLLPVETALAAFREAEKVKQIEAAAKRAAKAQEEQEEGGAEGAEDAGDAED